jgi:hypothetical protein
MADPKKIAGTDAKSRPQTGRPVVAGTQGVIS